jgi:hypothetical protein
LFKKAHLRRWLGCASLRRTTAYVAVVPPFAALHLDLFEQPATTGGDGSGKLVYFPSHKERANHPVIRSTY